MTVPQRRVMFVRLAVIVALLVVNLAVPGRASEDACEACALCLKDMQWVPCCGTPIPGTSGVNDCHDDDDECHPHGELCLPD